MFIKSAIRKGIECEMYSVCFVWGEREYMKSKWSVFGWQKYDDAEDISRTAVERKMKINFLSFRRHDEKFV